VTQADAVAESKAASEAALYAPQAHAAAEKLQAEARTLYEDGRQEEASIAGDQAIAAYTEAFALARIAQASQRLRDAETSLSAAEVEMSRLDLLQSEVSKDADAFEMRARVHLDTEVLEDVQSLTPERAKARQLAAKQLAAEARLLCLATRLLDNDAPGLDETTNEIGKIEKDLSFGSVNKDLYPRAASVRSECLRELSSARRPVVEADPESAKSDRLFKELSETGRLFSYRDDRGVVVNIGDVLNDKAELNKVASELLQLLGAVAKSHPDFPLLLVVHTSTRHETKRAALLGQTAETALKEGGAPQVTVQTVDDAQPLVSDRVQGAKKKNERVEVVFVTPGR
jgi:hypothetical protein